MNFHKLALGYAVHAPVDTDGGGGSGGGASSSAPANPYACPRPAAARARTAGNTAARDGAAAASPPEERADAPPARIQASNTDDHDDNASRLWRICRARNGQPVAISLTELEGRGAEHLMTELCVFATAQPIPINFDDDLNPRGQSNRCCVASTLTGYAGKYLKFMRRVDPNHPDWKDLKETDVPVWWTVMRAAMFARCSTNEMKWQGTYEWGTVGKRPLYIDLEGEEGSIHSNSAM